MKTNTVRHIYSPRQGDTWCRVCNCTEAEHTTLEFMDEDELSDYVAAHGDVRPLSSSELGLAYTWWSQNNDYATIASEIVYRRD